MGKRKLVELTLEKMKETLDHLKKGESCRRLADEYSISKSTVSNIRAEEPLLLMRGKIIVVQTEKKTTKHTS
jgi:hypothetical protein